jgi:hypothetical protein
MKQQVAYNLIDKHYSIIESKFNNLDNSVDCVFCKNNNNISSISLLAFVRIVQFFLIDTLIKLALPQTTQQYKRQKEQASSVARDAACCCRGAAISRRAISNNTTSQSQSAVDSAYSKSEYYCDSSLSLSKALEATATATAVAATTTTTFNYQTTSRLSKIIEFNSATTTVATAATTKAVETEPVNNWLSLSRSVIVFY